MNKQNFSKKTVAIVEDDHRLQQHLVKMLDQPNDITCLCAVSSAEEAMDKIPKYRPDVVLMDINLPGVSGIDCIRELKRELPHLEVVMLTAYEEEDNIFRALKEGASGYLLKTSTPDEIYDAIRDVFTGGAPFSSHIARKVAHFFRGEKRSKMKMKASLRENGKYSNFWLPVISTKR